MFLRFLKVSFIALVSAAAVASATVPVPQCPPVPLAPDGGFDKVTYKYVLAKISTDPKTSTAENIVNILSQVNIKVRGGLTHGFRGCAAESHIDTIANKTPGAVELRIRVDARCMDFSDFGKTYDEELNLMRTVIENIAKIPGLQVDPRWAKQPPCLGGGATGSN